MLLKVTSQIRWNFLDRTDETFIRFMEIVSFITKENAESEEDKARQYWEKTLIDSWERLIDREEVKNYDFFVVKENLLSEIKELAKEAVEIGSLEESNEQEAVETKETIPSTEESKENPT